jgi:membrane protease YdiL (CAAX protease family)
MGLRPLAAVAVAAGLLAIGRWARLSASEWGLTRRALGRGLRYGLTAFAAITAVIVVAALVPATRDWFDDQRADVDVAGLLFRVVVAIPVATVLVEELAFRGSVLALLRRMMPTWPAVVVSSVLFGLWHVPPLVGDAAGGILGTVLVTFLFGMGLCWLRLRSGSLVAPALAHLATNSVAFSVAWLLVRG